MLAYPDLDGDKRKASALHEVRIEKWRLYKTGNV
jgi:hypothetical protein